MNIVDRRVDNERIKYPIRATNVREDVEKNKNWLDNKIYNDYKKYI